MSALPLPLQRCHHVLCRPNIGCAFCDSIEAEVYAKSKADKEVRYLDCEHLDVHCSHCWRCVLKKAIKEPVAPLCKECGKHANASGVCPSCQKQDCKKKKKEKSRNTKEHKLSVGVRNSPYRVPKNTPHQTRVKRRNRQAEVAEIASSVQRYASPEY